MYDTLLLLLLAVEEAEAGLLMKPLPGTNSFAPTFNFVATTEAVLGVVMVTLLLLLLLLLPPSVVMAATASDDAFGTDSLLLLLLLIWTK